MEDILLTYLTSQQWWVGLYADGEDPVADLANAEISVARQMVLGWGTPVEDGVTAGLWWIAATDPVSFTSTPSATVGGFFLSTTETAGSALAAVAFDTALPVLAGEIVNISDADIIIGLSIGVAP